MTTDTDTTQKIDTNDIAIAYNEYLESYNELCTILQKSRMSVMKGLLSLRLTERDEITFALAENERLALYCAQIIEGEGDEGEKEEGEFKLDVKSILPRKKKKKSDVVKDVHEKGNVDVHEEADIHNRKESKVGDKDDLKIDEKSDELKVIDPIKLVHGGFVPLSIRNSQKDMSLTIQQIIKVVNKKQKINKLLDKYSKY